MTRFYKVGTYLDGYHIPNSQQELTIEEFFEEMGEAAKHLRLVAFDSCSKDYKLWTQFLLHDEETIGVAFYAVENK